MRKVGDRVIAVCGTRQDGEVEIFGRGVYEGDFVPEVAVGWLADAIRENKVLNPRIRLDNGKVVYGCECWWGSEEQVMSLMDGKTMVEIDIDEKRKECESL